MNLLQRSMLSRVAIVLALIVLALDPSLSGPAQIRVARASPPAKAAAKNPHQILPPVLISDQTFQLGDWDVSAVVVGDASYTFTQQLTGGIGSPPFRFMSHRLPPVLGSGGNTIFVTHVYTAARYDPRVQGAITSIDYSEAGKILNFPFPEAFSTTQPVVVQGGHIYRSPKFIRFIASNSSHDWETKSLTGLTAADFIRVGGSENDHPNFSSNGGPIQFGFTRNNSRTSTLPPVPANQDMVIDQGVDNWQIIVKRQSGSSENRPPVAADDVFILDGYRRSLPLLEIFDVVRNDSDPDQDPLEVIEVAEPTYGSASILSLHTVVYQLDEARTFDSFGYTIRDRSLFVSGDLTATARASVWIDCACTVLCLNQLEPLLLRASPHSSATEAIDLPLIYRFRDQVLKPAPHGRRYVDMYYTDNPEILVNILLSEALRTEAVDMVELWQDNLRSLTDGDGSAVITQAQVDAIANFLSHLSAASSAGLQGRIADELDRLGSLNGYVGVTMKEAKSRAIGNPVIYVPMLRR